MSTLLLDNARISKLADLVSPQFDLQPQLLAVSGAMYVRPEDSDQARLNAAVATARSSCRVGVPHLFMLDTQSPEEVTRQLRNAGAIVVPVAEGEGGLARPYLTAALVINELCRRGTLPSDVLMVKVEPEKNVFGGIDTPQYYLEMCAGLDIVTGERTAETWESMPHYLSLTESVLSFTIGQMLQISGDTPSGVLVLNHAGRELLLEITDENSWTYLIRTPFEGLQRGLRVSSLPVTFTYYPSVTNQEDGNPSQDDNRRNQFRKMYDYAATLAAKHNGTLSSENIRLAQRFMTALRGVRSID